MARQRFIHPELWSDPAFGRLKPDHQVLFIGLFSLADDQGRIRADPAYLRSVLFTYKDSYSSKKVLKLRDELCAALPNVHLYQHDGHDFIALLKWADYQKPKYPTASKLPPPFPQGSPNAGEGLGEGSPTGWVGLGRDGLGGVGAPETDSGAKAGYFKVPKLKEVDAA